jgi:response regulator of citrate/malate metabolism
MINVLIVEDDPMVAEIHKRYLNSIEDFKMVAAVENGLKAFEVCARQKINMIILDIYMPEMDGMTLLRTIRERHANIDVIMITASKETKHISEGLQLGAVDYLIKPFEYDRFVTAMEKYKERFYCLQSRNEMSQVELDRYFLLKDTGKRQLKKGVQKNTLRRIRHFISAHDCNGLSSEAIANELGLSKVTVRRYLEYLEELGEVKREVDYGSVGRPSYLYYKV